MPEKGYWTIDGARLEFQVEGDAAGSDTTYLLLHEGLGCVQLWRNFPRQLAQRLNVRVVSYSRRGYGRSSPIAAARDSGYMHDEAQRVLPRVIEKLEARRLVLLGHSDGASIALIYLAGSADQRVRAGVCLAPHVFVEQLSLDGIASAAQRFEQGDLRQRLLLFHGANTDGAFHGWCNAWLDPAFRHWDLRSMLPSIVAPLCLQQGLDDEYGTVAQTDAIESATGGHCETLLLENSGHHPHFRQTEAVLDAIAAFHHNHVAPRGNG